MVSSHMLSVLLSGALPVLALIPGPATAPAYDLGFGESDLVVVGRIEKEGAASVLVLQSFKGGAVAERVPLARLNGVVLHVRPPSVPGDYLLFLKRIRAGYVLLQRPGLTTGWDERTPKTRALRDLLGLLQRLTKAASNDKQVHSLVREVASFAARLRDRHPGLAASATLALARRPDLAPKLARAERLGLRSIVEDARAPGMLRASTAQCLAAAEDRTLAATLARQLSHGQAAGLSRLFGRLLRHQLGEGCVPLLRQSLNGASANGRLQSLRALHATDLKAARECLKTLQEDPRLADIVKKVRHEQLR